jgi:hypothetical protein
MTKKLPKKENQSSVSEFLETDFGNRKISHINQSRMIALPKVALENACGGTDDLTVNVRLVQNGTERYLKLVPVCNTESEEDEVV